MAMELAGRTTARIEIEYSHARDIVDGHSRAEWILEAVNQRRQS